MSNQRRVVEAFDYQESYYPPTDCLPIYSWKCPECGGINTCPCGGDNYCSAFGYDERMQPDCGKEVFVVTDKIDRRPKPKYRTLDDDWVS